MSAVKAYMRMKLAAEEKKDTPPNPLAAAATGTGAGLLGGVAAGGIRNFDNIQKIRSYVKGLASENLDDLRNRSRFSKTLPILKGRLTKSMLRHGLIGAGVGLGTGLLGATAMGSFD